MKKLVTIVSAVMMLLMLAACVPSMSIDEEQAAAIEAGSEAMNALYALADELDTDASNGVTLTATADDIVVNDEYLKEHAGLSTYKDYTFKKGATVTYTSTKSGDNTVVAYQVKGTVVDGDGTEVSVDFDASATYDKDQKLIAAEYNKFIVDGVGYEPVLCSSAKLAYVAANN